MTEDIRNLEKIKEMLIEEKREILERLAKKQGAYLELLESQVKGDIADQATALEIQRIKSALSSMERQKLQNIDDALKRIEDGTYGICSECGRLIDEKRLMVKPFAVYCVKCREKKEKNNF
jgi:DnaK suppressor protein